MVRFLFAFLTVVAAAAPAGAFQIVNESHRIGIGCRTSTAILNGHGFEPGMPGWSHSGSWCNLQYDFATSLVLGEDGETWELTLSRNIAADTTLPYWGNMGGTIQYAVYALEDIEWWDGISYEPECDVAPCTELWQTVPGSQGFVAYNDAYYPIENYPFDTQTWRFRIVPEPGTAALLAIGLTAAALPRSRSCSRATSG